MTTTDRPNGAPPPHGPPVAGGRPGRSAGLRLWWRTLFARTPGRLPLVPGPPSRRVRRHLVLAAQRDAEASLPVMSAPVPAPTATVTGLVAERDLAVGRELWLATRDVEQTLSTLAALRVRIAEATLAVDGVERRLAVGSPATDGAAGRRLGEDALDEATVAQRRYAEARRRDDAVRGELAQVTAVRGRLLERAADLAAHVEQRIALAQARAGEWHGHVAEQCAVYVEELTRRHADGPTLLHLQWPVLPALPDWCVDRESALALLAPDRRGGEHRVADPDAGSPLAA